MSETDKQKANSILQAVLYMTGIGFICAGAFGLSSPESLSGLFDADIARIFSSALIIAGFGDFVLAKFIFSSKDRK